MPPSLKRERERERERGGGGGEIEIERERERGGGEREREGWIESERGVYLSYLALEHYSRELGWYTQ